MSITITTLTRAAALSAVAGGLLFAAVQIRHPQLDATFAMTTDYAVRESVKILMAVLSLVGITGIYLRQVRQTGVLGLLGFVVFGLGYLAIFSVQIVGVFILPHLAVGEPGYVNDVFAVVVGTPTSGDIGALGTLIQAGGAAYIVGGILFGTALFRAGVLARWAAALLAVGTLASVAIHLVPLTNYRLFAIPTGVALVGLGWSLWRDQRSAGTRGRTTTARPELDPAGVR
jgi:ethanolamine utilization microcompartment shell protein EutS